MSGNDSTAEPTATGHPWDEAAYQRFAAAEGSGHELRVQFENGDDISLDVRNFVTVGEDSPDWSDLSTDPYELAFQVNGEPVELSWLQIRALSDDALAAHLVDHAEREARQVGHRLRVLRERRGLSAREVADRAGLAPQSLSRIERGRHDLVFSTLVRLLAAMHYDLADLNRASGIEVEIRQVRAALASAGLDKATTERVLHGASDSSSALDRVRRIFDWSPTDVAGPNPPPVLAGPALAGRFKDQARGQRAVSAYVTYAYRLATLVEQAAKLPPYRPLPEDPHVLAAAIRERFGDLRFFSLARFLWDSGVPVIPLQDRGQFHGACWLINDRPVVALKQSLTLDSRWAFDLGHETGHVARHLNEGETAIVELEEIDYAPDEGAEREASDFAGVLLLGDPQAVAEQAVEAAGGQVERLKGIIPQVAKAEGIDAGVLANYLAHRLSVQGVTSTFWGVAANLQSGDDKADEEASRLLREHIDEELLEPDDRLLLQGAMRSD